MNGKQQGIFTLLFSFLPPFITFGRFILVTMEKTRVAIIDLGTNTFNLLITEVKNNSYHILLESKYPTKLGKGGIHKATITPMPWSAGWRP
jgi:hypothetical protein